MGSFVCLSGVFFWSYSRRDPHAPSVQLFKFSFFFVSATVELVAVGRCRFCRPQRATIRRNRVKYAWKKMRRSPPNKIQYIILGMLEVRDCLGMGLGFCCIRTPVSLDSSLNRPTTSLQQSSVLEFNQGLVRNMSCFFLLHTRWPAKATSSSQQTHSCVEENYHLATHRDPV